MANLEYSAFVDLLVEMTVPDTEEDFLVIKRASDGEILKISIDNLGIAALSPLTTKGDIWGYSTEDTRLPVGTNGQVLSAASGQATGLQWVTPLTSPVTTKGDLWGFSSVAERVPIGTNGYVLTANSDETLGLEWAPTQRDPRVTTITTSATPTPNSDTTDEYCVTELDTGATFGAPTGTPAQGRALIIRIKDDGSPQTLAYNAIYREIGVTLPTTTSADMTIYLGMLYNTDDAKWDVVAVKEEV